MSLLYALLGSMAALAMALLFAALRPRRPRMVVDVDDQNIRIAAQRIAEVATPLVESAAPGTMIDTATETTAEIKTALLADLHATPYTRPSLTPAQSGRTKRIHLALQFGLVLFIPLLAFTLYHHLGSPQFAAPSATTTADIDALITQLEAKLVAEPDNPRGWALAGRVYRARGAYQKAQTAYQRLNALVPNEPDYLSAWGEVMMLAQSARYTREVAQLVEKSLAINPNHPSTLWLAVHGAASQAEYADAITYLQRLAPLLANDPAITAEINELLNQYRTVLQPE